MSKHTWIDDSGYCSIHDTYQCECYRPSVPMQAAEENKINGMTEREIIARLTELEEAAKNDHEEYAKRVEENVNFYRGEYDPNGLKPEDPGSKLDGGKILAGVLGDFSLALMAVAEVGTHGAEKYSRGGWQSVPDGETRYRDADWRHLLKSRHEAYDQDSGLLHDAHRAWNVLAALELRLRKEPKEPNK